MMLRQTVPNNQSRFAILNYHRIALLSDTSVLGGHIDNSIVTSRQDFEQDLRTLSGNATVVSLQDALRLLESDSLPVRSVVLTFDDGYREHFAYVRSTLDSFNFPSTMFITGLSIDRKLELRWLDWLYLLRDRAVLNGMSVEIARKIYSKHKFQNLSRAVRVRALTRMSSDIKLAAADIERVKLSLFADIKLEGPLRFGNRLSIGWHTITHPYLSRISPEERKYEIEHGIRSISNRTGKPMAFAYPFGGTSSYDIDCIDTVQHAGFFCACTSLPGYNSVDVPRFELRRFDMVRYSLSDILEDLI